LVAPVLANLFYLLNKKPVVRNEGTGRDITIEGEIVQKFGKSVAILKPESGFAVRLDEASTVGYSPA
jgi:hypothetical protein